MKISVFYSQFKNEKACKKHLKSSREEIGIICKKCQYNQHKWLEYKEQWQCLNCGFNTTLKSGTVMESSNLKIHLWYQAIYMMSCMKKSVSACELQRQLGLKRYEPAWYMMHKIRKSMAMLNETSELKEDTHFDNIFFTTIVKKNGRPKFVNQNEVFPSLKTALILSENKLAETGAQVRSTDKIKFIAAENLDSQVIWRIPRFNLIGCKNNYRYKRILAPFKFEPAIPLVSAQMVISPWLHTAIRNLAKIIVGVHHFVSSKFAQLYYEEYTFKFNHRNHIDKWQLLFRNAINNFKYDCG